MRTVLLWMCVLPLAVSATAEETDALLRSHVDADGAVDAPLAKTTGWTHVQGIRWRVQRLDPRTGRRLPPPADGVYATGEYFTVTLHSQCTDCWIYLLNIGTSGKMTLLFPADGESHVQLKKGQQMVFPPGGNALRFNPPAGVETLRIIAAPEPLRWNDPAELFRLEEGTKSVAARRPLAVFQKTGGAKALQPSGGAEHRVTEKSLGEVVAEIGSDGALRSKDVSLMPPPDANGQQELIVARAQTPPAPLVVDLSLEHR